MLGDRLAVIVEPIFLAPSEFSSTTLWLGVAAYAVQAYCDFSGYTDMAIGAAHAFGFKLPQNFCGNLLLVKRRSRLFEDSAHNRKQLSLLHCAMFTGRK